MAPNPRPDYTARPGEAVRVFLNDRLEFAIGRGRVTIASDDTVFVDAVTRDIGRLAHQAEGEAALRRGDALGHPVRIAKPDPPTEPPNAWVLPDDSAGAAAPSEKANGCGSTIVYDPAGWPRPGDPDSPTSAEVLLIGLRQANENAEARGNASAADRADPRAMATR